MSFFVFFVLTLVCWRTCVDIICFAVSLMCHSHSLKTPHTWPLAASCATMVSCWSSLLIDIIAPVPVAVTEVECVCEGYQSEALRRLSGTLPENQCFTVVFKGARKSLDLKCPTAEEAQHWVRGLRMLKERVARMSQKEKLDQYPAQFPIC